MPERHGQQGQATPLMLVAVLLAAVIVLGVAQVGSASARRAHAQASADAAALAGAAGGEAEASRFAAANGATLVGYREEPHGVTVEVERSGIVLSARARWMPGAIP